MARSTDRRSFLSALGFGVVGASLLPEKLAHAGATETARAPWDLAWLDTMKGKHRQVFDLGGRNPTVGQALRVPRNWLNAHKEVYGLDDKALSTCVGITSQSFPINASDALYMQYPLGEHFQIKDPSTGQWAKRNIWLDETGPLMADGANVRGLQARGTVFWQCSNALNSVVQELFDHYGGDREKIRADLIAGLNPGVKFVPAHTMLLGLAQERGFTYEKV
jgi:hypothetical protein